jgi:hypothetical protein
MIVTLVGPQDVDVTPYRSGTDGATIGVRVGGALIHLTDAATAAAFFSPWRSATREARSLPVRGDRTRVAPISGVSVPAAYMEAGDCPPALSRLDAGTAGQPRRMWITLGRMTFHVHDQEALTTTTGAFRLAARLAPDVFLPTPDQRAMHRAAVAAAQLLASPTTRTARPRAVASPAATVRPPAPVVRRVADGPAR